MLTKIKRNKKGIIKARILELVKTERYSIPEIKDIVVDRDNYCSKATFYRYLIELKKIIEEIRNKTDLSDDTNSYERIKEGSYNLHYKSKSINHKAKITMEEFEKVLDPKLAKQLQLKKLDNEISCDK